MREVITLNIGQAGCKIGECCWELYCLEHGIPWHGENYRRYVERDYNDIEQGNRDPLFYETPSGLFIPRTIFADLDPHNIQDILHGPMGDLISPFALVSGREDASDLYTRAYYMNREIEDKALDRIRKHSEMCDSLHGFIMNTSTGGGTGCGLGSRLLERMKDDYTKQVMIDFAIYPSRTTQGSVVEPYNSVFYTSRARENSSLSIPITNESLYSICTKQLEVERPSFSNINRIIAQLVSSVTAPLRFDGDLNVDFHQLVANLVPFPTLHYAVTSMSPWVAPWASHYVPSDYTLTDSCFNPENQLVSCDTTDTRYLTSCLLYRGMVSSCNVCYAISDIKRKRQLDFSYWSPDMKLGWNDQRPRVVPESDLSPTDKALTMLSNCTAIGQVFSRINHQYDLLYSKRAFVHWFVGLGIKEETFEYDRSVAEDVVRDYGDIEEDYDSQEDVF